MWGEESQAQLETFQPTIILAILLLGINISVAGQSAVTFFKTKGKSIDNYRNPKQPEENRGTLSVVDR
ncbi:MAG: hypothetical protein B6I19_08360 [Bacteroidetes bacterium 4572_114]|nr:MAG: hypothetical protein B6I19_08360 [Bacteroidetes bacterium 4572_114]